MGEQRRLDEDIDADIVPKELSIENEPPAFVRGEVDVVDQMKRTTKHMDYVASSSLKRGVKDEDLETVNPDEDPRESAEEVEDLQIDEAALKGEELFERESTR